MNPSPNAPQGTPQGPRPNSSPNGAPPSGKSPIPPNTLPNQPGTTPNRPNTAPAPTNTVPAPPSAVPTPTNALPTPPQNGPSTPPNNSTSAPRGVPFDTSSLNTNDTNQSLTPKWNRTWILLATALVAFMIFFWAYGLGVRARRPMPLGPVKSPNASPTTVRVYVEGAVLRPGVYSLSTDARVSDAITLAGGLASDGDPAALNLAAFVQDGGKISVPHLAPTPLPQSSSSISPLQPQLQPPTPPTNANSNPNPFPNQNLSIPTSPNTPSSSSSSTKSDKTDFLRAHPLDLNTATKEELQTLPSVGPVMADRIITYRTINGRFKSVSDLDNIQGIGEKRLEALKDLVTVR